MNGPVFLITVLSLSVASAAFAVDGALPAPNWDRAAASEAVDAIAVRDSLADLYRLARSGQREELLSRTRAIAEDRTRPAPERDRILYELALGLGELDPGAVGPEVLEFLGATRSLVRVPHDENRAAGVPLFNIRAAAAGSLAQWKRAATVPPTARQAVPFADAGSYIDALGEFDGPTRAQGIRKARDELGYHQIEALVIAAPERADAVTASLVLAELAPAVIDSPAVRERLFGLLGNRDLGAPASLALARSGDEAVLLRLADLAADGSGLEARRASMAIDLFLAAEDRR